VECSPPDLQTHRRHDRARLEPGHHPWKRAAGGFILRRNELAEPQVHTTPLDVIGADTQGSIGYMLAQALGNEFKRRGIERPIAAVVTQVLVDQNDPGSKTRLRELAASPARTRPASSRKTAGVSLRMRTGLAADHRLSHSAEDHRN